MTKYIHKLVIIYEINKMKKINNVNKNLQKKHNHSTILNSKDQTDPSSKIKEEKSAPLTIKLIR